MWERIGKFDKAVEDGGIKMYVAVFNRLPHIVETVPIAGAMGYKYTAVFDG